MKELKEEGKIDEATYNKMVPVVGLSSQPARLYGTAKVHKTTIPLRPVLLMPGSVYHPIANVVTDWMKVVPECQINTSTKSVADSMKELKLEENEVIVSFDVRFKAGVTVDWDRALPLFSDGIPGDQRWFETDLFDSGQWVIMIKSKDRTGWVSDDTQFVKVNLGDALPTNVVVRTDLKDLGFPGQLENLERINRQDSGLMYPAPTSELFYQPPLDDEFYEGSGGNNLVQIDASLESRYFYPFSVTENDVGLLVLTQSTGTYQWFLRKDGGDVVNLMYPEPITDPMYPDPQSDYFYRTITADLSEDYHPIAAFEKLGAGNYTLACKLISLDGTTKAEINDVDIILDYPDIMETFNDVTVPVGGTRIEFVNEYNQMKAINLTLQDSPAPGVPQVAMVTGKDRNGFNVRCYDLDGQDVEGLVDATCVGY